MIASGASNSPTGRWKGRLHREHASPEFYISKRTFDTLRAASEDSLEEIVYEALVGVLKPNLDGKGYDTGIWYPAILRPEGSHSFQLAGINPDLCLVAVQGRPQDFSGEGKSESIVMLHYLDEESDHGWKDKFNELFGKKLVEEEIDGHRTIDELQTFWYRGEAKDLTNLDFLNPNDFDPRLLKVMPTDLIAADDQTGTNKWLKSEASEVRLSDDPRSHSKEQSEVFDMIDFGISPSVNLTGRPGSGKSTVATVCVAEAILQRGPRRTNRKALLVTTTNELAELAWREIETLVKHVYNDKNGVIFSRIKDKLYIESRDSLIKEFPQEGKRLNQETLWAMIKGVSNDPSEMDKISSNAPRKDFERLKAIMEPDRIPDLRRALVNLVFGVFGSVNKYLQWYDNCIPREERDARGLYREFCERPFNFDSMETTDRSTHHHRFTLSEFWDPFSLVVDEREFRKMSEEEKLNSGRVTLAALALFLQSDVLGGKLQSDSGEGLWTHSSVLSSIRIGQNQEYPPGHDYERFLIESGSPLVRQTETGKAGNAVMPKKSERKAPLWSEENLNDFDTIIFDESQDFSTNEIMTILRTFSIRAGSGERGDRGSTPFMFFTCGDPLQTIEGSLFDPRNDHIKAAFTDWKTGLDSTIGLSGMEWVDLKSNYRNARPIVERAVNPMIREMARTDLAKKLKRSISSQTASSSKRGFVVADWDDSSSDNGFAKENKFFKDALIKRLAKQITDSETRELIDIPDPTVMMILPLEDLSDPDQILAEIPEDAKSARRALERLMGSEGFRRQNRMGRERLLGKVGISDVGSAKGLTVPAAIVVNFGRSIKDAEKTGDEYEVLRKYSHFLVAVSRPQFGLLLMDEEPLLDANGDHVISSTEPTMDKEFIERMLSKTRANLDPESFFDDCMSFPNYQNAWELLESSLRKLQKRRTQSARSDPQSEKWRCALEFSKLCRRIHRLHHQGNFLGALETLEQVGPDHIVGSQALDRESALSVDSIKGLSGYLYWRAILEGQVEGTKSSDGFRLLDDTRRAAALPKSVLEFSKLLSRMDEESVAKFISGIASTPGDLTPFEGSGRPNVPSWQDSMMVLPVPGAWFFEETEKGFGMNHRNSWSTPLTLLNKAVLRDCGREDEQSIRVRWFLNASRDPGGLWECIEDLQNLSDHDAGLAIRWLMMTATEDTGIRSALTSWLQSEDHGKREKLLRMIRNWWNSNNAVEFMEKTQIFSTMLEREDCRTLIQDLHGPLIEYCSRDDWLLSKIDMTLDEVNHQKLQKGKTKTVPNPPILVRLKDRSFLSMIVTAAPNRQSDEYLIARSFLDLDDAFSSDLPKKFESAIRRNSGLIVSKGGKAAEFWLRQCGDLLGEYSAEVDSEWFGKSLEETWQDGAWQEGSDDTSMLIGSLESMRTQISSPGKRSGTTSGVRTAFDSFQWRLRDVTTARVQNLLFDLYMDCRDSAGAPRSIDHPVLNYLLSLHSENFLNGDPELLPLSMSLANWRNGHSFWDPENEVAGKMMERRKMTTFFPGLQGRLYQSDDDKHIATPRFSMVPPQSSRIPRFSSGLQGIVAYMSVKDDLSPEQLDKLRSRFRMAGAYQEAAVVGLARAVIIAFDTRTRKKREEIIRSAISEALRERPGVYFDHASRDNEWAEDGTVGQRNKSYKSDDFIGAFGLRRVTQEPNETVGVTVSHAPLYDQRGSYKSFSWIYNPRGRRKSDLDPDLLEKYYKSGKEERARIAQSTVRSYGCSIHQSIRAVEQLLPYLVLAETLEHPGIKVAEWFSRRPELEYRVHDELVEGTFGAQDFLENKLLPWTGLQDAEGITKSHALEELIEDLSSTGDGWMYELSTNGRILQDLSIPHSWDHNHVDNVRMTISEILPRNLRRLFQNLFRVPESLNVESVKGKKIATKEIVPGGIRPSQTQSYSSESTEDLQKALDRIKEELERRREASE